MSTAAIRQSDYSWRWVHDPIPQSLLVAVIATGLSYLLGFHMGWIEEFPLLETASVFTSYSCTWLVVRQSRWNYPMGAVSVALLCWLFLEQNLLASAVLNAYLFVILAYGWVKWTDSVEPLEVTSLLKTNPKMVVCYLGITAIFYAVVVSLFIYVGGKMSVFDSFILIGSILAQFLLSNKRIETWAVWAVVNVVSIYVYFSSELYLLGVQFIMFLVNTGVGGYSWYKSMK